MDTVREYEVTYLNGRILTTVTADNETAAALLGAEVFARRYQAATLPVVGSSVHHRYVGLFSPVGGELFAVVVPVDFAGVLA